MPNTYTQIHIQVVFAVQNRQSLIQAPWQDRLYQYITGIIQSHSHKVLQIGGMPDHVHLLFGMRPTQALSELMKKVKGRSSTWINQNRLARGHFSWQEGYGAFSYAKTQVPQVIRYIKNQEQHHQHKTFLEEYHELLDEFDIDFDDRYVFKAI
jgi:REP element-mobilizing transposase RayT